MRLLKMLLFAFGGAAFLVFLATFGVNAWVYLTTNGAIETEQQAVATEDEFKAQCIIVLGAGINNDGSPSTVLRDRLDTAISLYKQGAAPKIVMSGDNTIPTYNEVMAMALYAIDQGVPKDDVFCDHAGINTYDSMFRLRDTFNVQRCLIVTQRYHLYRALYIASSLGMDVRGVAADAHDYEGMADYEKREFLARIKDFWQSLAKMHPHLYSERVSLEQSGTVTQWWR